MKDSNRSSSGLNRTIAFPSRASQRGTSLFFAIVALVIMTVAGLTLMRSVDTGNIIAGNMAFRETTVSGADNGVEAAATYLNATIAPAPDANLPAGCTVGTLGSAGPPVVAPILGNCRYSARIQPEDDDGVPLIDWTNTLNIPVTTLNGNDIQYVVERLCNPDPAVVVILTKAPKIAGTTDRCGSEIAEGGSSSKSPTSGGGVSKVIEVMYRVTVRVKGPRNTLSTVQTILAR